MQEQPRIAVLGGGSWATALVKLLLENIPTISWYMRNENTANIIRTTGRNPKYLSGVYLRKDKLQISSDINEVVADADIVILAIPSAYLKNDLAKLTVSLSDKTVVSAIKGIIPDDYVIVGDYVVNNLGVDISHFGVISGPCHAEEVALERLSYLTIAFTDKDKAKWFSSFLETLYIKTTISDDIFGTEYAAVLKNIFAIASGIASGLGYGDNFNAVLVSNALQEMSRFASAVYPITRDIADSAYLGDLLVTAYSRFSRNRNFGTMLGKGYSVRAAKLEMQMVAEGYYATKGIYEINREYNAYLPIIHAVYDVVYGGKSPVVTFQKLSEKLG